MFFPKKLSFVATLFIWSVPLLVLAAPIVPCSGSDCDFCQLAVLLNNIKNFMLFNLALPMSALAFIFAGIMFLTGGDSPDKIKKGKDIFKFTIIGLIISFGAWVIVDTILRGLLDVGFGPWNKFPSCQLF